MVVVASFPKFAFPVKTSDHSTRQRYHYNDIVFKSFHFGDRFQKLSLSVKTIIVLIVFMQMQVENAKKSLLFR